MRNQDGYNVKSLMSRTSDKIADFAKTAPSAEAAEQMLLIADFAKDPKNTVLFDCDELMTTYAISPVGDQDDAQNIVRVAMNIRFLMQA